MFPFIFESQLCLINQKKNNKDKISLFNTFFEFVTFTKNINHFLPNSCEFESENLINFEFINFN